MDIEDDRIKTAVICAGIIALMLTVGYVVRGQDKPTSSVVSPPQASSPLMTFTADDHPCGRRALLEALELADQLFVPPSGLAIHGSAGDLLIVTSSISAPPTPRTAAEHRAEAERLAKIEAQQAAEQHQRSAAAQKIRDLLRACR